jgi:hypothetical protein
VVYSQVHHSPDTGHSPHPITPRFVGLVAMDRPHSGALSSTFCGFWACAQAAVKPALTLSGERGAFLHRQGQILGTLTLTPGHPRQYS